MLNEQSEQGGHVAVKQIDYDRADDRKFEPTRFSMQSDRTKFCKRPVNAFAFAVVAAHGVVANLVSIEDDMPLGIF